MDSSPKLNPKCPRCGADDVQLVSSQHISAPLYSNQRNPPIVTISAHKCRCGMGFTDAAKPATEKRYHHA